MLPNLILFQLLSSSPQHADAKW